MFVVVEFSVWCASEVDGGWCVHGVAVDAEYSAAYEAYVRFDVVGVDEFL